MTTTTTDRRPRSRRRAGSPAAHARTPAGAPDARATGSAGQPVMIDAGMRLEMISRAAYYLAERRGFDPGHELEDWLAAESEIDLTLTAGAEAHSVRRTGKAGP